MPQFMPPFPLSRTNLKEWLESYGGFDVVPGQVIFHFPRVSVYQAARYKKTYEIGPGCQAYDRGERSHTSDIIYVIGGLPKAYWREKLCFPLTGDNHEWFVGSYGPTDGKSWKQTDTPTEYAPFGASFMLMTWNVPDKTAIDRYEKTTYRRVSIEFIPD